jgi:hypothetical protein
MSMVLMKTVTSKSEMPEWEFDLSVTKKAVSSSFALIWSVVGKALRPSHQNEINSLVLP